MASEEQRLAEAAAYGARLGAEFCADMERRRLEHGRLMETLRQQPPMPPFERADLGEALRQCFGTRSTQPDPPPRPRLVLVKS